MENIVSYMMTNSIYGDNGRKDGTYISGIQARTIAMASDGEINHCLSNFSKYSNGRYTVVQLRIDGRFRLLETTLIRSFQAQVLQSLILTRSTNDTNLSHPLKDFIHNLQYDSAEYDLSSTCWPAYLPRPLIFLKAINELLVSPLSIESETLSPIEEMPFDLELDCIDHGVDIDSLVSSAILCKNKVLQFSLEKLKLISAVVIFEQVSITEFFRRLTNKLIYLFSFSFLQRW